RPGRSSLGRYDRGINCFDSTLEGLDATIPSHVEHLRHIVLPVCYFCASPMRERGRLRPGEPALQGAEYPLGEIVSENQKRAAAAMALTEIRPGMRVGLGTGSTARHFVDLLGAQVAEGFEVICIPTSEATAAQARA